MELKLTILHPLESELIIHFLCSKSGSFFTDYYCQNSFNLCNVPSIFQ